MLFFIMTNEQKQKRKEYLKEYYQKNKEKIKERGKEYYEKNKETIREDKEKWKEYYRAFRERHKERLKEYRKERRKNDPLHRLTHNLRVATSRFIKGGKSKRTEEVLGCSFEEMKEYLEQRFSKGMSWDNYGEWEIDHIIPLASATTEEQLYELNHHTNLQPLWAEDNRSKGAK